MAKQKLKITNCPDDNNALRQHGCWQCDLMNQRLAHELIKRTADTLVNNKMLAVNSDDVALSKDNIKSPAVLLVPLPIIPLR